MTVACQDPPVRTSSTAVPGLAGSQPSKWLGCVRTCQTLLRGGFRVRVTMNSLIGILHVVGFAGAAPKIRAPELQVSDTPRPWQEPVLLIRSNPLSRSRTNSADRTAARAPHPAREMAAAPGRVAALVRRPRGPYWRQEAGSYPDGGADGPGAAV